MCKYFIEKHTNPFKKKQMKNLFTILIILITSNLIFSQNIEIIAKEGKFIKDENLNLIVCNYNITEYDDLTGINSLKIIIDNNSYEFEIIPVNLQFGVEYEVVYQTNSYRLYFSIMPIINIYSDFEIVDEPKILADFILTDTTDADAIESFCGIELRGNYSQSLPKKSYDIELWEDETGAESNKISLLNMRDDDDWILISMYNEPLRIRNVTNHSLWRKIHTPYYIDQEDEAMSGIKTQYVEIAVNNEYLGIYALGEQIDKKQLQLKKYNSSIRGELYKAISWGAPTFSILPAYNNNSRIWGGFEMKYPKEDEITDWENIYNFVDFVINSTNENFENGVADEFIVDNAIDYFIFLNLLRATDNTGKNTYIAKYSDNEPYFYVPWDLDGTYGIIWNGNRENITNDILSNGFYERLLNSNINVFRENLANRWFELRENNALETDSIINSIYNNYYLLLTNGNYDREILKWGNDAIDLSNLEYTNTWINERFNYLDTYFSNITNITSYKQNNCKIYPNPTSGIINLEFANNNIKQISISDLTGKTIIEKVKIQQNEMIDLSNFESGIYIIKIQTDNEIFTTKIIKE